MNDIHELGPLMDETTRWVIEMLQNLETKARILDPGHPEGYEDLLTAVEGAIKSRLSDGQWQVARPKYLE
jgi:hypothetical protein